MKVDVKLTGEEVAEAVVEWLEEHRGLVVAEGESVEVFADDEPFAELEVYGLDDGEGGDDGEESPDPAGEE